MSIHFFPAGQIPPSGSANVGDVRSGKTFTSGSGSNLTGTLAEAAGGNTITPGTASQQAIAGGTIANAAITVAGDANLVAANILSGKSIFGVAGSLIQGTPYATGNTTSSGSLLGFTTASGGTDNMYPVTVSGLNFTPKMVILIDQTKTTPDVTIATSMETIYVSGANNANVLVNPGNSQYFEKLDGTNAYLNNGGFRIPLYYGSRSVDWYAYAD